MLQEPSFQPIHYMRKQELQLKFKTLQKQHPKANLSKSSSLSSHLVKLIILKVGANEDHSTMSEKAENVQHTCLPTAYTKHTSRFNLYCNCWDPSPSQSVRRRLDKSHPKRGVTQLTPDGFKVCWQTDYQ